MRLDVHKRWYLWQDNAPVHRAAISVSATDKLRHEMLSPQGYPSGLALSDIFFLFLRLKRKLTESQFQNEEDVVCAAEASFCEKFSGSNPRDFSRSKNGGRRVLERTLYREMGGLVFFVTLSLVLVIFDCSSYIPVKKASANHQACPFRPVYLHRNGEEY